MRYTGIFTKLPNIISRITASAEVQENPSLVNAGPIIPRINSGRIRIKSTKRMIIAITEIGVAEKIRMPSLKIIPALPVLYRQLQHDLLEMEPAMYFPEQSARQR